MKQSRLPAVGAVVALSLVVAAVFWPTLQNDFVALDDAPRIYENPKLHHLSWDTVRWAFSAESTKLYVQQPLTWLSLAIDYAAFGPSPAGFHAVNLALHAVAAILLLLLLSRTTGRLFQSAAAAALFSVHPLTVEPVAWATERNTLLASAFGLLAAHAYVAFTRRPSTWRYFAVVAAFAASLLAKPWLFGLPLVFLALDFWPLRRRETGLDGRAPAPMRRLVMEKLPLLAMAGGWALVAACSMERAPSSFGVATAAKPLVTRLGYAAIAAVRYLGKLIAPINLAVYYPYPDRVLGWEVAAAMALIAALTTIAIVFRHRAPSLLVGWIWFLVLVAPTLGVLQAGTWPAIADRFAYMPMVGLTVAVVFGLPVVGHGSLRTGIPLAVTAVLIAVLSMMARVQLGYWHDTFALVSHSEAVAPGAALVECILGHELGRQGRLAEAEALLRSGIRTVDTSQVHNDLGNVLLLTGRNDAAREEYERAVARDPKNAEALYNLARVLQAQGRSAEARQRFIEFVRVAPASLDDVKREVEMTLR